MKRIRFSLYALFCVATLNIASAAGITFDGSDYEPIKIEPEKNTGLENIFVLHSAKGVEMAYIASSLTDNVEWYRFSNLGGGFAEKIENVTYEGKASYITLGEGDMGYIIEINGEKHCYWITDYSRHPFHIESLQTGNNDCDANVLQALGEGVAIHYFTINGQQRVLSRDIEVSYYTLSWQENDLQWEQIYTKKILDALTQEIRITPPALCSTQFIIEGDRFLKEWGLAEEKSTTTVAPYAVACATRAEQEGSEDTDTPEVNPAEGDNEDPGAMEGDDPAEGDNAEGGGDSDQPAKPGSNQLRTDVTGLGGSAPAEITFYSYITDAVLHPEWQLSREPDFSVIENRFNEQDVTYTFTEEGKFYMRFVASNADGSCDAVSDTYIIEIGASDLLCPNAFTPNGDGVNDEWKVAYRSLLDFECWIFDRYGNQICHFSDPTQGWDGKRNGKIVKPGVYYYVINATGADGKKYKKSGDINVITYRRATQAADAE